MRDEAGEEIDFRAKLLSRRVTPRGLAREFAVVGLRLVKNPHAPLTEVGVERRLAGEGREEPK